MPRDGSGVYSKASASFVAGTTIASAAVNADIDDLVTDLNTARPVVAGGTGATSVIGAWDGIAKGGTDIPSAATLVLSTATGPNINITGNVTVTAVTLANQSLRIARATGAFQLTASATLVVNGSTSVNYTTAVNDLLVFEGGSGLVYVNVIGATTFATRAEANAGTLTTKAVPPAYLYFPTGHLWGLTLSNNSTNKLDIAVGTCRDSGDTTNIILGSALTAKDLATAWAVGSSAGMLATGVAVANGTYHIFLIMRPDTGVVDVAADTSVTGANIATNTNAAYTLKRRIGSIIRSGGSILSFAQVGDRFRLSSAVIDVDAASPGSSAVTRTLTTPLGIVTQAIIAVGAYYIGTRGSAVITPLSATDQAPQVPNTAAVSGFTQVAAASDTGTGGWNFSAEVLVATDTSSQVRSRQSSAGGSDRISIVTFGWIDTRGRI